MTASGCERAREWISVDLDGQLSELERALLRAHVARCDACAGHAQELAAATTRLRFASLEQPKLAAFVPPRRLRVSRRNVQALAAAAAVAAAVGLGAAFSLPAEPTAPARSPAGGHVQSRIVDVTDLKLSALGKTYLQRPTPARATPQ